LGVGPPWKGDRGADRSVRRSGWRCRARKRERSSASSPENGDRHRRTGTAGFQAPERTAQKYRFRDFIGNCGDDEHAAPTQQAKHPDKGFPERWKLRRNRTKPALEVASEPRCRDQPWRTPARDTAHCHRHRRHHGAQHLSPFPAAKEYRIHTMQKRHHERARSAAESRIRREKMAMRKATNRNPRSD